MISLKQENVDITVTNHSDFSIEHILNHAGNRTADKQREDVQPNENQSTPTFSWLQCTRFCPPKIARVSKRDPPHKRQLGRYPRIPFTNQQIAILEDKFQQNAYLSSEEAVELSRKLQLAVVKIKIWFQNRRARKRREDLCETRKQFSDNIQKSIVESNITQNAHSIINENSTDKTSNNYSNSSVPIISFEDDNFLHFHH